jgi:hypothetical protein
MKYPKRSQYKYVKSQYRVRNWPEYEAGLKKRGDLTVWLSDDALEAWRVPAEGKPGGQRTYSDVAIEAALTTGFCHRRELASIETSGLSSDERHTPASQILIERVGNVPPFCCAASLRTRS